jgi:hypothetical protein
MSTTTLYLIRHGIAAERGTYADDRDRPLTAKGRDRTERVAQRLSQLGLSFDALLSSPLVRAYETAEILVYQGLAPYFTRHDALAPGGDLADWLTWVGGLAGRPAGKCSGNRRSRAGPQCLGTAVGGSFQVRKLAAEKSGHHRPCLACCRPSPGGQRTVLVHSTATSAGLGR